MRWWRHGIWLGAVVVTGAVLLVALLNGDLSDPPQLTAVLSFGVSVIGLSANLWRNSAVSEPPDEALSQERLERLTERLATAVEEQWQAEWRLRRLQDPHPLHVQWSPAEGWLSDAPEVSPVAELNDRLSAISATLDAVPSRRLVVLGGPGSGKTVLAIRFVLDRIAHRASGDPVPVIFTLSSWQPDREPLRDWMVSQLRDTYPGAPWTVDLLRAGLVLPVLDGLDEMPKPSWGTALQRLNAELDEGDRVLLTCRSEAYARAVETGDVFTAAAVVELRPLTFDSASAYLVRTARPVRGPSGQRTTRWDPVLAYLGEHPDTAASRAVRQALATPLIVAMARAVYGDTGEDPAELISDRFADPEALEQHLLEAFVPAAFSDSPQADEARGWLACLAAAMQRQRTRRLAWWQLRLELPWLLRRLGPILLLGCIAVAASMMWVLAVGTTSAVLWEPPPGVLFPAVTGAFIGGVCLGYLVLSHDRHPTAVSGRDRQRVPREALSIAAVAVPVGLVVGCTAKTSLTDYTSLPATGSSAGWLGPLALAAAFGLATATALTVLGVTGEPFPLQTPLAVRPRITAIVIVLLAVVLVFIIAGQFFLSVTAVALAATLAGCLVALGLRNRHKGSVRTAYAHPFGQRVRGRFRRALLRGLGAGVLIGLCLGSAFGIAAAIPLSIRATQRADFPHGTTHHLPDGTRYVVTPDGWLHGLRPNRDRYLSTPLPVDGVVEDDISSSYAYTAASPQQAAHWDCSAEHCTPFHGRIELRLRNPGNSPEVRIPNGTYVQDGDFQKLLPVRSAEWLFAAPPAALFSNMMALGLTIGLALGLVGGVASGAHAWLVSQADTARAVSPRASLHTDRTTAIIRGVAITVLGMLTTAGLALLPIGLEGKGEDLLISSFIWVFVGPLTILLSAWGWFCVTRVWLCGTKQLPWRLVAFLHEAHQRGVLRQAGATYEFRHARLQEHLASRTRVM